MFTYASTITWQIFASRVLHKPPALPRNNCPQTEDWQRSLRAMALINSPMHTTVTTSTGTQPRATTRTHAFPVVDASNTTKHQCQVFGYNSIAVVQKHNVGMLPILWPYGYAPKRTVDVGLPERQILSDPLFHFFYCLQEQVHRFILQLLAGRCCLIATRPGKTQRTKICRSQTDTCST
jgi:hypothetical protein